MSSFLIANQSVGLQRDLKPWLLPEDGYVDLENASIFRGRTVKKDGAERLGSLSLIPVAAYPVALAPVLVVGTNTYNISAFIVGMNGVVPGSLLLSLSFGPTTLIDNGNGSLAVGGSNPLQAFIDYRTSILTIIVPAGSPFIGSTVSVTLVHTFPATRTPVMGIGFRQLPTINFEQTVWWDQVFAYIFTPTGFQILDPSKTWTGTNSDFFWSVNVRNPLLGNTVAANNNFFFATNFNIGDPIRYIDNSNLWTDFAPLIFTGNFMFQARCIVQFKNRLLFFNTWEGTSSMTAQNYPNRLRFSWIGDPTDQVNGYVQAPTGKGGFIDAAISEQVVSVAVLKDCVLVKFETVSWRIVYTGNPYQPFEWQKVNQEFGSDSTFSSIQFDDFVLTVGNRAITQDSSVGVKRIDEKIPDEVFEITNENNGPKRVWGIRDFPKEQVYWTIPYPSDDNNDPIFPNRILNFSYRTGAFAFYKDSFTALGRFQNQTHYTWGDYPHTWGNAPDTWGSAGLDFGFENITAGNQQGNVFLIQRQVENDPTYEISSISIDAMGNVTITIPDHNLDNGDFVEFSNVLGQQVTAPTLVTVLLPNTTILEVNVPTTGDPTVTGILEGDVVPGTVTVQLTQTNPILTVNWYDLGNGTLLADTPGYSGSIVYEDQAIQLNFPAVPIAPNISTVTINYQYSLFNGRIFAVLNRTDSTFLLGKATVDDQLEPAQLPLTGTAFSFGQLAYLTNFNISTKQFNPFVKDGRTLNMPFADLYIDGTETGNIAMQVFTNDNRDSSNIPEFTTTNAQWEISTINDKDRFWTRVFTNARGEFVQLVFYIGNQEMMLGRSKNEFVLHGLMPNFQPSGRLIRARYP